MIFSVNPVSASETKESLLTNELVVGTSDSVSNESKDINSIIETFTIEDLQEHQDVVEYLISKGNYDLIISDYTATLNDQDSLDEILLNNVNSCLVDEEESLQITLEQIKHLNVKYGLEENARNSVEQLVNESYRFFVKKDNDTKQIRAIWVIKYNFNQNRFSMFALDVGTPLDNIYGTVNLYGLNGLNWTLLKGDSFDEFNVFNQTFYTMNIPANKVKEKIEYDFYVQDNGSLRYYSNVGKNDTCRYNFAAGPYSSISANGGERHHFVSNNALSTYGFNTGRAYAIRMTKQDHTQTGSYGSSRSSIIYRNQEKAYLANADYVELLNMEIEDLQSIPDPDSPFSLADKYYDEILSCLVYYQNLFGI